MRLCWKEKPISDCSADQKIEAACNFGTLIIIINKHVDESCRKAALGINTIEEWLKR